MEKKRYKRWVLKSGPLIMIYGSPPDQGRVVHSKSSRPKDSYDLNPLKRKHRKIIKRIQKEGELVMGRPKKRFRIDLTKKKKRVKLKFDLVGFEFGSQSKEKLHKRKRLF